MRAQQSERELARQQFVVSEPRPRRAVGLDVFGRLRAMDLAERFGKARIVVALAPRRILPFRQIRQAIERRIHRFTHLERVQPFGERIDRIDQRQFCQAFGIDHAAGMQHLQMAVIEGRCARHVTQLALGQELFQIIPARVEIGDGERVGIVVGVDIVGRARPVRRRRAMPVDGDRDCHDGIGDDFAQLRLVAAVDKAGRQVKQQIDNARLVAVAPNQAAEQFFQLRPDPRQGFERSEQRIEDRRAH